MSDYNLDNIAKKFTIVEDDGSYSLNILVDGMHCPSCVQLIEKTLYKNEEIISARLNLSTKRLKVIWRNDLSLGNKWLKIINKMGYKAVPFNPKNSQDFEKIQERFLLKCLAVAGFASGNLMLFSIPMWTSNAIEMGDFTRSMFHWIQLIIAIPAIIYAGIPFYKSAIIALKEHHTNMDVPISVAVILSTCLSVFQVINKAEHSYLDSSVMLLFFLLIGRYLEAQARGKARGAAHDLLQMMVGTATLIDGSNKQEIIQLSEIKTGMILLISAGERIGADGEVIEGETDLDTSIITGETLPQKVIISSKVFAGTINIGNPIKILVTKASDKTLLAEIIKLMEVSEQSQAKYVTIADKISRWYTPVVHLLAAMTFILWWIFLKISPPEALLNATTVLIITCPCALGLAVPVVQVLASSKLMRLGILLKSGSALERLNQVTDIVFDKTGTLTIGKPTLINSDHYLEEQMVLASNMAANSKHPLAKAICEVYPTNERIDLITDIKEIPGQGIEAKFNEKTVRLGNRNFCGVKYQDDDQMMELWLNQGGNEKPIRFIFSDQLRKDAKEVITKLKANNINLHLLSGDRKEVVVSVAEDLKIDNYKGLLSPLDKCKVIEELKASGAKVLMIGDGLNDAPSLTSSYISMSPSSAIDITQNAADIVFQGNLLNPILVAFNIAKFSQILVRQNFMLAILYNIIAVPLAVMGYVTPLIAAIAMSSSSIIVIANAMRMNLKKE